MCEYKKSISPQNGNTRVDSELMVLWPLRAYTLMCLSIGTPKNNKFSICSKWKIHYF